MKNLIALAVTGLMISQLFLGCRKKNEVSASTSYTSKMAGVRTWHGKSSGSTTLMDATGNYQTSYFDNVVNDTVNLTSVNDTTIIFFNTTLHMDSVSAAIHAVFYTDQLHSYEEPNHSYVIYYYLADSMSYHNAFRSIRIDSRTDLSTP
jgi:hypothetical protein